MRGHGFDAVRISLGKEKEEPERVAGVPYPLFPRLGLLAGRVSKKVVKIDVARTARPMLILSPEASLRVGGKLFVAFRECDRPLAIERRARTTK